MVDEIRIYVEGGGDGGETRAQLRQGFNVFFTGIVASVRKKRIHWNVVPSGSRSSCFEDFCHALESHPNAFNILLVDSECTVTVPAREHLRVRDTWDVPASDEQVHLMAQTMEAWLVADQDALAAYYGDGFQATAIPANYDVEDIDKTTLESALDNATRHTQKGRYKKIQHGAALLGLVNPQVVRAKAGHCDLLFSTLESLLR